MSPNGYKSDKLYANNAIAKEMMDLTQRFLNPKLQVNKKITMTSLLPQGLKEKHFGGAKVPAIGPKNSMSHPKQNQLEVQILQFCEGRIVTPEAYDEVSGENVAIRKGGKSTSLSTAIKYGTCVSS